MQELVQSLKIVDDKRKQVILEILADKYCKLILHSTLEKPKSAMEISGEKKKQFLLALYIEDYKLCMMQNYLLYLVQLIRMEKSTFYTKVK